ncbi:UNVERIFIED_CONTAM: hypothetical protein PYX00_008096 [Menopon gallinae]|uniref:BTB domain-containing protein n=1 Tax=Menopon gallinae TaxID=328185 RepID=A0AAW2HMY7_9NEOP
MTDQQFCLRWNNHQSTLVAVFDGLLEKGVLVDCTLAAEGQQLTAHKVVLAACSPFLETLLSRHYDKHPILILKDVKFSELKAMMDYMYRGEVNISQDQLGTFLKAAESLQIKGLSDGGGGNDKNVDSHPNKRHHDRKQHRPNSPLRNSLLSDVKRNPYNLQNSVRNSVKSSSLLVDIPEDSPMNRPRDGSMSPVPRKKKRPRDQDDGVNSTVKTENIPLNEALNNHQENSSNSLDLPNSVPVPRVPSPSESKPPPAEPNADKTELKHEIEEEEDINEDSVELTLEDEDLGEAGPSHNDGEFGEFYGGTQDGDHRDGQGKK